ncbi:uncharacterized protein LOC132564802, partial [Ylistrum balloti]|uniref:uncharacterized protein LOC132564802 n=1 Tax=Ylistrum balloti TaxID=509963 RepID=UPI002905EC69
TVQSLSFPPLLEQNLYAFIPEDLANGSLIRSFNVTDSDHDNISLGIFDESTRSTVYLNETNHRPGFVTGNVYLINPENIDFDRGQSQLRLAFTANDGLNTVLYA